MKSSPRAEALRCGAAAAAVPVLLLVVGFGCSARPSLSGQPPRELDGRGERLFPEERQRIEAFRRACPSTVHVATFDIRRDPVRYNVLEIPKGTGSGFVWDREGHVVTNAHVIRGAEEVRVLLKDGSSWIASVLGSDATRDLAVLMIGAPQESLRPVTVETSGELRVGQTVLAIGNPFGFDHTLTVGVVSALERELSNASGLALHGMIQVDAAINPGNSGGPLLDSAGRLIGINTALVSPSGAFAGLGFAVPVDVVGEVVTRLLGRVPAQRPGLGIRAAQDAWVRELGLSGVLVLEVLQGGPAERAGVHPTRTSSSGDLELGDIIVVIEGTAINSRGDLTKALEGRQAGERVAVTVRRGEAVRVVPVVLALEGH